MSLDNPGNLSNSATIHPRSKVNVAHIREGEAA